MQAPLIELIAARPAGRTDAPTELDVLVRITPPRPEVHVLRPPINLALVLDRSGSMASGGKMRHAIDAAAFAVEQLLPTDRLSVTIFDDEVETIVPNTPAEDRVGILARLRAVTPGGTTALHAGWAEGAAQVERHRIAEGLNRVLLLSDGLANVGLTDPRAIAVEVKARQKRGISTTTMGVGDDYNEDLMEAAAIAGDGNYYYIESPKQLADIFQTELQGLMATAGRDVVLTLEPRHGVEVAELLNDFDPAPASGSGQGYRLPNLIVGIPVEVLARLQVPPLAGVTELLRVRLTWTEPGRTDPNKAAKALILPAVPSAEWEALPEEAAVRERVALLTVARLKLRAREAMAGGDLATTQDYISQSGIVLGAMPPSPLQTTELADLEALKTDMDAGEVAKFLKRSGSQRYWGTRSRRPPGSPPNA